MIEQDTIFLLSSEGRLDEIPYRPYQTEHLLQELIDQHPELLVGEQIDPDNPPRWLMVQREAGIPDSDGGYDRWSIDHVLLDQHGRPTLVEVKRSTDTRIRREVVGQMLDYAANALKYWPKDRIRELASDQCGGVEELRIEICRLLRDEEADVEEFWQAVDRNLREEEMRLLFVADQMPTELRRIIEFLNEHMPRVEVLGVEIRQYERDGTRVLVPRVVGQTESARQSKSSGRRKPKIDRASFLEACSGGLGEFFESLLTELEVRGIQVNWGTTGFSARWRCSTGSRVTLGYGVVAEYYGAKQPEPVFEVFLGQIPKQEDANWLREQLQRSGYYLPHGENEFHLQLEAAPSTDASQILAPMFQLGECLEASG